MVLIATLVILVVGGLVLARRGLTGSDGPERLVAAAARHLPPARQDWGRAMTAELTHVTDRPARWRFAGGVVRVALFPPARHRGLVVTVAIVALAITAVGTAVAAITAPAMAVFAGALGVLLGGYATAVACRWPARPLTAPRLMAAAVALTGTSAAVAAVVRIAIIRPAAATDSTHLFAILLALAVTACLALVLTPAALGQHLSRVMWWAVGGALASTAAWVFIAIAVPFNPEQVTGYFSPVSAAAVLVASACVGASTRSLSAGAWAGVLTAVLGAPIHFAIDMSALLQLHNYALTNPFDVAAYAHSGYPTVASYVISDTLGGYIIGGLFIAPIALTGLALLAGAAGSRLRPATPERSPA
jgi:hypothetical protein